LFFFKCSLNKPKPITQNKTLQKKVLAPNGISGRSPGPPRRLVPLMFGDLMISLLEVPRSLLRFI
jgi:hypothetical protein